MLRIQVTNENENFTLTHLEGPLEFGRLPDPNIPHGCKIHDKFVSKSHVLVNELSHGRLEIANRSGRNRITLIDQIIEPGGSTEIALPVTIYFGKTEVEIECVPSPSDEPVAPPSMTNSTSGSATKTASTESDAGARSGDEGIGARSLLQTVCEPIRMDLEEDSQLDEEPAHSQAFSDFQDELTPGRLLEWFETVIAVQRAAAGSREFYEQTAKAVVRLVGLDRGLVLLRNPGHNDPWRVVARHGIPVGMGREFSRSILDAVATERRTFYQSADMMPTTESLFEIESVVASPIFGQDDEVVGVVFGSRSRNLGRRGLQISALEAQVVQLLAAAVGTGLSRLEHEAQAARVRVQFEQFFPADLADELQQNPILLEGQEREITVMFLDIRGFSKLAQRLSPRDVYRLAGDVLDRITNQIRQHSGVVVDYAGDGILAMWNAPTDQPDHAERAARTALAIINELPAINDKWGELAQSPIHCGIGLNSGISLVGNAGTQYFFKYGPRGHTVNLGSRVEGATKQFGVPILMTEATQKLLPPEFATRRICKVRVVGIAGSVDLYELRSETIPEGWDELCNPYECSLHQFETGLWSESCQTLAPLLGTPEHQRDVPSLTLIARAVECLRTSPDPFDPVFELTSK